MIDFYRHLGRKEGKAEALRQAQLDMLNSGVPPYYWAGFDLDGEPSGTLFREARKDISYRSSR
jgi:CHAT domain-containing protein